MAVAVPCHVGIITLRTFSNVVMPLTIIDAESAIVDGRVGEIRVQGESRRRMTETTAFFRKADLVIERACSDVMN